MGDKADPPQSLRTCMRTYDGRDGASIKADSPRRTRAAARCKRAALRELLWTNAPQLDGCEAGGFLYSRTIGSGRDLKHRASQSRAWWEAWV